jgi:fucose 4-O-acetylase-like acetyltransferase
MKQKHMHKRLMWADNAKALGMLLVFWGHILEKGAFSGHYWLHEVYKCIYAFHMPMFFLLAGFFFRPKPQVRFGTFFVQRIKMRLVPVLFFVAAIMPFWLWKVPGLPSDPGALQQSILLLQGKPTAIWTCWFLICLFSVELIASELLLAITKPLYLFLLLMMQYGIAYEVTRNVASTAGLLGFVDDWWFLQEAMMALFFYLAGYLLARYGQFLLPGAGKHSYIVLVISAVLLLTTYNLNFPVGLGTVNMSGSGHGHWFWFPFTALMGSLAAIHLGGLLPPNKLVSLVGENTLPLLGFAGFFLHFFNTPLWNMVSGIQNEASLLCACFMIAAVSLLVSLPFAYLLSRYTPFLVGHWK